MNKRVCKQKKYIEKDKPKYQCKKCNLTVKKKNRACKPEKIKK